MGIPLTPRITAFPVRHGKAVFAMELRKLLWSGKYEALAVALPAGLRDDAVEGADGLPAIRALVIRVDGSVRAYLPFDPCDAYVEGLRQARQRRMPVHFLEDDALLEGPSLHPLPDAYLIQGLGTEGYYALAKRILSEAEADPRLERRSYRNLAALRSLEARLGGKGRILFLCDFPLLARLEDLFQEGSISGLLAEASGGAAGRTGKAGRARDLGGDEDGALDIRSYRVKPGLLYFALGEPPFFAGEMEKERQAVMARPLDYLDLVKGIFVGTRNQFLTDAAEADAISIKKVQTALNFLRNLAIQQGRLTPDLLDMVTAAKGVFGNAFAAKVLEAARYYPFIDPDSDEGLLEVGMDHIQEPGGEPEAAFNLLEDEPKVWKTIHLKKEPDRRQQRLYRYAWDPRGMCSHFPEDGRIEGFNRTVRRRSRDMVLQAFSRTEKLTASLKDGIDVRETLRNWTTGGIYVKEVPPARGKVDTVVILFDQGHDDRYPQRTTWYAEHEEESTLTFYATDPLAKLIGPGIAEAQYGGLSLLFPPRPLPNIFAMPLADSGFRSLAELLIYGALMNSREKTIALVSPSKPGLRMKQMAARFRRRITWVPMASFSAETLRRLRKFHILNGKHVRAWASRFIEE